MKDLRSIARRHLRRERFNHTLRTTALVHEVFLRIEGGEAFEDPAVFFPYAARTMRQILVDHARHREAQKRGGGCAKVPVPPNLEGPEGVSAADVVALHEALERLAERSVRQARLVELKYFAGLTIEEIVNVLGIGRTLVIKESRLALAFLKRELAVPEDE